MSGNERRVLKWRKFQASRSVLPRQREIGAQTVNVVGRYLYALGSYPFAQYNRVCTYVYDRSLNEWTELSLPTAPPQRFGHVSVLVDDKLFLFGGAVLHTLSNKLYVLDLSLFTWTEWHLENKPPPLFTSTAHFIENLRKVLVVCGKLDGGLFSENVYALDPDEREWMKCSAKGRSPTCAFHASCIAFDKLYVIGGATAARNTDGTVVSVFDFSLGLQRSVWSTIDVDGETARSSIGSSLVYFGNGKILHLGGKRFSTGPTADRDFLHWYDLRSKTVCLVPYENQAELSCSGAGPTERRNFGFAHLHDKVMIFGGYLERVDQLYELDISPLL